jgi:penicillin amidase
LIRVPFFSWLAGGTAALHPPGERIFPDDPAGETIIMKRVLAILAALPVLLVLALALVAGGAILWLRLAQPQTAGHLTVPGLEAPVTVARSAEGVPTISAGSDTDAAFALGFVHAQDRLWQMEMMRRAGAGRLSEVFGTGLGDTPLRLDRLFRTLGFYRAAGEMAADLPDPVRALFEAYAAGVNAWMTTRREPLPVEFQIFGLTPEPWRLADSLVWGRLIAWQLSSNVREEVLRARLLARLSPEQVRDLFPGDPPGAPATLAWTPGAWTPGAGAGDTMTALATLPIPLPQPVPAGSNAWAVAGRRTMGGQPLLANDPHLELDAPALWYLARLDSPGLVLAGATVPGVPLMVLGHNGRLAWGITTAAADTQDLFVEAVDPADPQRYRVPGGTEPFRTRREIIAVRGGADEVLSVRETRHGPVLSDVENGDLAPPGYVLALAFTALRDGDTGTTALYRLNRAGSVGQAREALQDYRSPPQNFLLADTAGAIGYVMPGLVPVRGKGDGRVPVIGWTGEYDWTGFIPADQLPATENPASGILVNANNAPVGPGYPHMLAMNWPDAYRARRIVDMLNAAPPDLDALAAQQLDTVSLAARELVPLMIGTLDAGGEGAGGYDAGGDGADGPAVANALARLRAWDGRVDRDRPEPLIWEWWLRETMRALFADELGPLFPAYWTPNARVVRHVLTAAPQWCDDTTTPATVETCPRTLAAALKAALAAITARQGADPARWRWGAGHTAPFAHKVLGQVPGLGRLLALDMETDGDAHTVNVGSFRLSNAASPFADIHGAGFRAVYDLGDLDRSRFIVAPGQSGNPLSPHWADLAGRWRAGDGLTLAAPATSAAAATLTLAPP